MRTALDRAGIALLRDADVPLLAVLVWIVEEQRVPDAMAFNVWIELEQPARVLRVDRTLGVPTYACCVLGMDRTAHVADAVMATVGIVMRRLCDGVRSGTDAAERAPR